jgi:hypothetical protein
MGRESGESWSVRKCAKECSKCGKPFEDKETLFSTLVFGGGEYERHDLCGTCWSLEESGLSSWKTTFLVPPPPQEEAVKKENVESLLRKLASREDEADLNAIFILAVMLERKKILVERDVQSMEDGRKLRIYEHRKTNESFMVIDPGLKLSELEEVQEEVVVLLGGRSRNAESAAPPDQPAAADEQG